MSAPVERDSGRPCPTGDPHLVFVRADGTVVPHVGASGCGCPANDQPYKAPPLRVCETCGHPHVMEAITCRMALKAAISGLLKNVGTPAKCKGCQADIFWVTHRNGKRTPYTSEGLNHFVTCPVAAQFREARNA